jgi:hypothetical protein
VITVSHRHYGKLNSRYISKWGNHINHSNNYKHTYLPRHSKKNKYIFNWNMVNNLGLSSTFKQIKKFVGKWHTPSNLSRREDITTTRVRIGHTNLSHIHLIKHEEIPKCTPQCTEQLTIKHIILHCPKFSQSRYILNRPTSMEEALWEHNSNQIHLFFKAIGYISKI